MGFPPLLTLTAPQRECLEQARDHHSKPYFRERAAALLKLAGGASVEAVAEHGLLRPRHPNTLYRWVQEYRSEGVVGLRIRAGRGRKPAFSPSAPAGGTGHAASRDPQ